MPVRSRRAPTRSGAARVPCALESIVKKGPQPAVYRFASPENPRAYCSNGARHGVRHLLVAEAIELAQHDALSRLEFPECHIKEERFYGPSCKYFMYQPRAPSRAHGAGSLMGSAL